MTLVLIIGASRGIGLEAVKLALAGGYAVRALARSAERIELTHPSLEKRDGSALDPADVAAALDGVDAVIQAIGVSTSPEMVMGPVHLFSDSTGVLIPAMKQAGVKRLISVTGFGAGESRSRVGCLASIPFRLVLGRVYDDKSAQERLIRQSGLDWIIARPGALTDGPRTGVYRHGFPVTEKGPRLKISRADVADFMLKQLTSDEYLGQTPGLSY